MRSLSVSVRGTLLFTWKDSAETCEMWNKEEIRRIIEGFATSGLTRREYCAKHGVAMLQLPHRGQLELLGELPARRSHDSFSIS